MWGAAVAPPALPIDRIPSGASVKRIQDWSAASQKHDSLRAQSRRKLVSTHEWGHDSSPARTSKRDLPLARSPHDLHVRGVGASRRHSDGEVHHARADTRKAIRTSMSLKYEPASEPLHDASSTMRRPAALTRAPSLGNVTSACRLVSPNGGGGRRGRAETGIVGGEVLRQSPGCTAHARIAIFPKQAPRALPGGDLGGVQPSSAQCPLQGRGRGVGVEKLQGPQGERQSLESVTRSSKGGGGGGREGGRAGGREEEKEGMREGGREGVIRSSSQSSTVTKTDLVMLKWEHEKRLELAARHRHLLHEKEGGGDRPHPENARKSG